MKNSKAIGIRMVWHIREIVCSCSVILGINWRCDGAVELREFHLVVAVECTAGLRLQVEESGALLQGFRSIVCLLYRELI